MTTEPLVLPGEGTTYYPPEPDPTEQRIAELEATVAALLDLLAGA